MTMLQHTPEPVEKENAKDKITVKIFRFNPRTETTPNYVTYRVPIKKLMRIMDIFEHLVEVQGVDLAYRSSCGMMSCGSCGILANGVPKLACVEPAEEGMVIEPLANFPVIRDLVVDRSLYDEKISTLLPFLIREDSHLEFPEFVRHSQMKSRNTFAQCISCLLCMSACPIVASDSDFIGPAALTRVASLVQDVRDRGMETRILKVSGPDGVSRCHFIGECSEVCPVDAKPSLAIQILRRKSTRSLLRRVLTLRTQNYPSRLGTS
jgi:succinate dehydrogenase iron-sulfur subunit